MEHSESHNELAPRYSLGPHPAKPRGGRPDYPYPEAGDIPNSESIGLLEYWRLFRRHRVTVLLFCFFGLIAGILVTLPQTPLYRARTAIEIQNINNDFLNTKQINPVSDDSTTNVLTDVQTQMKIIQSENLVDRVVDKLKSEGKLDPLLKVKGRLDVIRHLLNLPKAPTGDMDYSARQTAMASLSVRQLGQTRMLEVDYSSTNPQFAADFLNTLSSEYIESNMEARWKMSERTGVWLGRQLDEMRIKLERSESALQTYAQRSGLLFTSGQTGATEKTNVSEEKLRELQDQLSKASADRTAAQSRYEIAQAASPETVGDVLSNGSLSNLQSKITELRGREAEMISIYTEKHEKVKRVQAQITPLQSEFDRERRAILTGIRNDFQSATRREKLLQADYLAQTQIVTDQAGKSIQYNILKRDVDSNRQLYENMLQQLKESSVASAIRASNVRIVDPAKTPRSQYAPSAKSNAAIGMLVGFLLSVAFVLIRERGDRTLQEPGDAQMWINVTELGVIPSAVLDNKSRIYGKHPSNLEPPDSETLTRPRRNGRLIGKAEQPVELISWQQKPSIVAEAFRTILTSILFVGENGNRPRVLVMTSAGPGDGKTTVVSNLGIAMAEIKRNVLIIDADLRRPRMHNVFNLSNEQGLSTLLKERSVVNGAVDGMIQETSIPGLHILPSGPSTYTAANLLYSPNMAELLDRFRSEYDLVLVDTPPMLQMTDARVLGRLSDGVILVTRAGKTTRDAAIAANQRLSEDRIRVIGTILNDWNPKNSPNGYYGYYSKSYHHYAE